MRRSHMRRRGFLGRLAATAAGPWVVSASALGLNGQVSPSNRVTLALIGAGGKGVGGMRNFMGHADCQVLAVCDPYEKRREGARQLVEKHYARDKAAGQYKGCDAYNDFREVTPRGDIDAVLVASTEQWHVLHSLSAIRNGKDVYCEKPLGRSVNECSTLVREVNRYARVFQHGTQLRSMRGTRFACELVRNGRIGKLHTVRIGSPPDGVTGNHPTIPVPPGFDYEMWLGPARWAPYCAPRCVTPGWYFISDYAPSGFVAEYAVHDMDIAMEGMGPLFSSPVTIEGRANYPADGLFDTPVTYRVEFTFASGVKLIETDAGQQRHGVLFEGSEGSVFTRGGVEATPADLLRETIGPREVHLYESIQQERNFLDCVKSRRRTICPAEVAHRVTSISHMAAIAMRLQKRLVWDFERDVVLNDEEANRCRFVPMREPWHL
ncbi:MAG: putative 4,5-dihydroxyphthalate dehydrogenase [Planctomycetes bacterium ADurb.Bin126]|nr:MAG: putative 4,5-dihydroxyphthalate dehydrogenase [Planctomycetes bacterium ADurb.Bin126]HOD84607.1 Gfo/Idh/MocA family oxidoreductase [Phycisphaerae bacterium]HQL72975.1 Gfo/Idh/MocA family oxidoreductase [Phycisphaerae bacterium]